MAEALSLNPTEQQSSMASAPENVPDDGTDQDQPWYKKPEYSRYWRHYKRTRTWYDAHLKTVSRTPRYPHQMDQYQYMYGMQYYMWWLMCSQYQQQWSTYQDSVCPRQYTSNRDTAGHFSPYSAKARGGQFTKKVSAAAAMPPPPSRKKSGNAASKASKFEQLPPETGTSVQGDVDTTSAAPHSAQSEFEMEITEDMLEFFAQSARHKEEKRAARQKEKDEGKDEKYIDLEDAWLLKTRATSHAPTEKPGQRRTSEMKWLYGRGAAMIHGMETAMQLNFDRNRDIKDPKLWPQLPINIKF